MKYLPGVTFTRHCTNGRTVYMVRVHGKAVGTVWRGALRRWYWYAPGNTQAVLTPTRHRAITELALSTVEPRRSEEGQAMTKAQLQEEERRDKRLREIRLREIIPIFESWEAEIGEEEFRDATIDVTPRETT